MAGGAPESPLFASLVERFGVGIALQLLPFLNGDSSTTSKAFAGAGLAGTAASGAGAVSGTPALSTIGRSVGTGLGLAGVGYNLANIAKSNAPTEDKVGAGVKSGGEAAAAYALPYGWLPAIAAALGGQLQKSGSPQVKAAGRGLTSAGQPIPTNPFSKANVTNPAPELKGLGTSLMVGGPGVSALLNAIGVDPSHFLSKIMPGIFHQPTTGTMFRREAGSIFDRIPALKGTDTSKYTIDPAVYNALPQAVRNNATALSQKLAPLAPDSRSNLQAYQNQLAAMILNRFGANLPANMVLGG